MEFRRFDSVLTALGTGSSRRRALAALGALALSAVGVVGLAPPASAARNRSQCVADCVARGGKNQKRQRRKRCRRICRNR